MQQTQLSTDKCQIAITATVVGVYGLMVCKVCLERVLKTGSLIDSNAVTHVRWHCEPTHSGRRLTHCPSVVPVMILVDNKTYL